LRHGEMDQNTKVNMKKERSMDSATSPGKMAPAILATLRIIRFVEKVSKYIIKCRNLHMG